MIDPVAFYVWKLPVRWYSLAYMSGFASLWFYVRHFGKMFDAIYASSKFLDDLFIYMVFGIICGGRIGYVLIYDFAYYMRNPLEALCIWNGGMSFHGGLVGALVGAFLISRKYSLSYPRLLDIMSPIAGLGIMLGRLANFVNGELYGRATNMPWGVVFAGGGSAPRHPTQIYEAVLEGLLPCILLHTLLVRRVDEGFVSGCYVFIYAAARIFVEIFREPDAQIGYIFGCFTAGQLLSLPMLIVGYLLITRRSKIS